MSMSKPVTTAKKQLDMRSTTWMPGLIVCAVGVFIARAPGGAWAFADQQSAGATPAAARLAERQRTIQTRLERLENKMLKLSRLLAESEPDKAERLRDALNRAGGTRVKRRAARLVDTLPPGRPAYAARAHAAVLADRCA